MTRNASHKAHAARLRIEADRDAEAHLPGVDAARLRDMLQKEADRPLSVGPNRDLAHASLFGDAHKQRELF